MGNLDKLDHIVFVCPDLKKGIKNFENLLGCLVYSGGRHLSKGTHNAIFRIGKKSYFEILAPDPNRDLTLEVNWLGTQNVDNPRISHWCIRPNNFEQGLNLLNDISKYSFHAIPGSRNLEDGTMLSWKLGLCDKISETDAFPFIIDWGESNHPSVNMKQECELKKIVISHPCPDKVNRILDAEEIHAEIIASSKPKIQIELNSPNGLIVIE